MRFHGRTGLAAFMAKLKPVRGLESRKKGQEPKKTDHVRDAKGAIPCLLLVIGGILLLGWLFSAMLKSAN
jgi:hypothetical protein